MAVEEHEGFSAIEGIRPFFLIWRAAFIDFFDGIQWPFCRQGPTADPENLGQGQS